MSEEIVTQSIAAGRPGEATKDDCEQALEQVYAFLDDELDPASAQFIRQHLAACEPCVESYDLELMVKTMIKRSCGGDAAPDELRQRIIVSLRTGRADDSR